MKDARRRQKRTPVRSCLVVLVVVLALLYSTVLFQSRMVSPSTAANPAPVSAEALSLSTRIYDLERRTHEAWNELTLARSGLDPVTLARTASNPIAQHLDQVSSSPIVKQNVQGNLSPLKYPASISRADILPLASSRSFNASLVSSIHVANDAPALSAPLSPKIETNRVAIADPALPLGPWKGNGLCGKDGIVAVTYASHGGRDDRFCRAVESAVRNNIPWEVLGWGVKWQGLSQKLQASLDYARSLDPDCIMLFSDAFDVLFTQDLLAIKAGFEAANRELMFAGECGCWPQVVQDQKRGFPKGSGHICNVVYPKSPTPYRFLNSGLWAGRASAATRLLTAVVKQVTESSAGMKTNDQELVSDMYINRQHNISLDFYAQVFQCMHETGSKPLPDCNPWKHMRESGGVWKNEYTQTTPAVFHFNGGGKKHHLEMEARAWYKQKLDTAADIEQVYATRLRFNGKMRDFRDICPKHLERTAALGGRENRPKHRKN